MASKNNSTLTNNETGLFDGTWEDVKDYTSATITIKNNSADDYAQGTILWAHTLGRAFPNDTTDIIAIESFNLRGAGAGAHTLQYDHRARWFKIGYETNTAEYGLQTVYKKAPTELKIVDDNANVVTVNPGAQGNSLHTVLTDSDGALLKTTAQNSTGSALFTHLSSSDGTSLQVSELGTPGHASLYVGLRDGSNNALTTTRMIDNNLTNNALFVRPSDSSGIAQASTNEVVGSSTPGVALFAALSDSCGVQITTTRNNTGPVNALYVHLTDNTGNSITQTNPLNVITSEDIVGSTTFNIVNAVTKDFVMPLDLSSSGGRRINLFNLFVYNDSQSTIFLKVHDTSLEDLKDKGLDKSVGLNDATLETSLNLLDNSKNTLRYNLAVQPGKSRDIVISGGATFYNGLAIRASTRYPGSSTYSPADNTVFVNGTYTTEINNII